MHLAQEGSNPSDQSPLGPAENLIVYPFEIQVRHARYDEITR